MAAVPRPMGSLARPLGVCRRCIIQQQGLNPWGPGSQRQRRYKHQESKYDKKLKVAAEQWAKKAEEIAAGTRRNVWDVLEERGFVKDTAGTREDIRELLRTRRIGAYVGVDPTAPSLHLGHLLPLMPLFWMYMHGYRAMTLIGSSTAKIGDPTDRLQARDKMARARLTSNLAMMHYQFKKIWVNVDSEAKRRGYEWEWAWRRGIVQNGVWWGKVTFAEVMRRLGEGMRMGSLLSRDTVKNRMEQGKGMSFAEFSYPLMQAWDWWHMWNTMDVQMQIGGSDQYGNIVTGVDAVKVIRDSEGQESDRKPAETPLDDPVGFTVPLLTDGSGAKFGKSAGNAVWLDPIQTSPFDLYAYLIGRPDDDVERLLKLFTFIPLPEIQEIMTEQNKDPSKRLAHHHLAYEVTRLVHGREVAAATQHEHRAMFGGDVDTIPPGDTKFFNLGEKGTRNQEDGEYAAVEGHPTVPNNAPRIDMQLPESLIMGMSIARILYAAGLATSTSDAQRVVVRKGAYVGGAPGQKARENKGMSEHQLQFTPVTAWFPEDTRRFLIDGKILILRKGKHNLRVIEMVSDEEWKKSGRTYPGEPFTGAVRQMKEKLKQAKEALSAEKEDAAAAIAQEKDDAESETVDDGQELVFPPKVSERMKGLRTQYDDLKSRLAAKRQSLSQGRAKGEAPWMKRGSSRVTRLRESLSRPGDGRYGR